MEPQCGFFFFLLVIWSFEHLFPLKLAARKLATTSRGEKETESARNNSAEQLEGWHPQAVGERHDDKAAEQSDDDDNQCADTVDVAKQEPSDPFEGRFPPNGVDRVLWKHFIDGAFLGHVRIG